MAQARAHLSAQPPRTLKLGTTRAGRVGVDGTVERVLCVFELLQMPKGLPHRVVANAKSRLYPDRLHRGLHHLLIFPQLQLCQGEVAPCKVWSFVQLIGCGLPEDDDRVLVARQLDEAEPVDVATLGA